MRFLPAAALILLAAPAAAAERTVAVSSFDRLRVDGGLDVTVATGRSPRATLSGDAAALDSVVLSLDGTTLRLHRRAADGPAVTVTLAVPALVAVSLVGNGRVRVTGMRSARVDLSVAGAGRIAAEGIDAEQAGASVIGDGAITLAGRAIHARLLTNGSGAIDAAGLVADDLVVRLDGPGETLAQARYLATASTTGAGRVSVAGKPKCTVRAPAGSAVACGR